MHLDIVKILIFCLSFCDQCSVNNMKLSDQILNDSNAYNNNISRTSKPKLKPKTRITSGEIVTDLKLARHLVSVRRGNFFTYYTHVCGGSILTPRVVVTAAHCVVGEDNKINEPMWIIAGTTNSEKLPGVARFYKAYWISVHPEYAIHTGVDADIALLHFKHIHEDGTYIVRIELPNRKVEPGENCVVSGWGSTSPYILDIPEHLLYINQTICPDTINFPGKNRGTLCAGDFSDLKKSVQSGDSGSPLVCGDKLSGLVSFDILTPFAKYYTDVFYYRDWIILNHTEKKRFQFKFLMLYIIFIYVFLQN